MPAAGRLEAVLVQPGEAVKEGQTLARLAGRESFEAALHSANLDLLEAQQALAEMPREAQEEAASLQLELLEAQKDLDEAVRYRAYLGYPEEVKESQIDEAQRAYNAAQKAYDAVLKAYQEVAPLPEKELKRQKILQALDAARLARDRALNSLNWLQDDGKLKTRLEADAELSLAQARLEELKTRLEALQNGPRR
jgi:multidrug efflux pump subunit AcrA (membrane-fusion protein)